MESLHRKGGIVIHTYTIGNIGADVVTASFPTSKEEVEGFMLYFKKLGLNGDQNIRTLATRCTIKIGVHKFIVGFTPSNEAIVHVELHATDDFGINLENMTMDEIQSRFDMVIEEINRTYKINLSERKNKVRIVGLELNRTFMSQYLYDEYFRIITLLGIAIQGTKFDVLQPHTKKKCWTSETTTYNKATYKVRIYDKAKELEDKKDIECREKLLRVELKYIKEQPILTDMPTNFILKMNQQILEEAYKKRFNKWKMDIEKYLSYRARYNPRLPGSMDTTANIVARHCRNGSIEDHGIVIADIIGHENYYKVPILLDIVDLYVVIDNLQKTGILSAALSVEEHFKTFEKAYNSSMNTQSVLYRQRKMYKEFFNKVLGNVEYKVDLKI